MWFLQKSKDLKSLFEIQNLTLVGNTFILELHILLEKVV